jgi:amidase
VFLPVAVEGALLAMGDLHALMGDGEVCICGAEVSGTITVRIALLHHSVPTPCVITPEHILFLSSALYLDDSQAPVLAKAHRFLCDSLGLAANEAARLMSLVGELRIAQVVDPLKTIRFLLPLAVLRELDTRGCLAALLAP